MCKTTSTNNNQKVKIQPKFRTQEEQRSNGSISLTSSRKQMWKLFPQLLIIRRKF